MARSLTPSQRQRIAREYEKWKLRGETALDIAIRWNVHPVWVSTLARRARTDYYAVQEAARTKREAQLAKQRRARIKARKRVIESRRKTKARQQAILNEYRRGTLIDIIARRYKCHRSYPAQLAKRNGYPRRSRQRERSHGEAKGRR